MDMHGKINQYITVAVKGKGVFADTVVSQYFAGSHLAVIRAGLAAYSSKGAF